MLTCWTIYVFASLTLQRLEAIYSGSGVGRLLEGVKAHVSFLIKRVKRNIEFVNTFIQCTT
jgi:hypothetical protein